MKVQTLLELRDAVYDLYKYGSPSHRLMQEMSSILWKASMAMYPDQITDMDVPHSRKACRNGVEHMIFDASELADKIDLRGLEVKA